MSAASTTNFLSDARGVDHEINARTGAVELWVRAAGGQPRSRWGNPDWPPPPAELSGSGRTSCIGERWRRARRIRSGGVAQERTPLEERQLAAESPRSGIGVEVDG
jgi:hypothetical protein